LAATVTVIAKAASNERRRNIVERPFSRVVAVQT
jgi:hypothetical protein